ncbi:hypothetical protein TNIN_53801 [Trichonephila inaurata madagascariensis]|uniref:Uncharacterized protein n=1 Tax=Trichonephila inaurata madagascariensis TaxID=2747483 RepID=A0A8X6XZN0_9ARAC|nr:hypothetical protein TNIN_53801 [Trichonephila inaurata madagascariensis]
MNQKKKKRKSCKLVIESDFECFCGDDEEVSKSDGHTCVGWERGETVLGPLPFSLHTHVCRMNLTSSSHLTWGRVLNRFRSIPTSPWPPLAKSSAPCACTLTAFFDLCKTDPLAKTLLYSEVLRHFRWDASQKVWQIRKKGVPLADFPGYVTDNALGRVCAS